MRSTTRCRPQRMARCHIPHVLQCLGTALIHSRPAHESRVRQGRARKQAQPSSRSLQRNAPPDCSLRLCWPSGSQRESLLPGFAVCNQHLPSVTSGPLKRHHRHHRYDCRGWRQNDTVDQAKSARPTLTARQSPSCQIANALGAVEVGDGTKEKKRSFHR